MLQSRFADDRIHILADALSSIGDGVIITDRQQSVLYLNAAAQSLTGYSMEQAQQQQFREIFHLVDFFSGQPLANPVQQALSLAQPVGLPNHAALAPKAGKKLFVSANCSPMTDEIGEITGVVVVFRDIDRIKNMEVALQRSKDAAESANRIKSKFVANMSHEIRTPLNGLIGMMDLLLQTRTDDEQAGYIKMAKISANALLKVIDNILDYSRIEAGKLHIAHVPFCVETLLEEVHTIHLPAAQDKGLSLTCKKDAHTPAYCYGDSDRLRQILNNLVGNAIKFTHEGSVTLLCHTVGQDANAMLEFCVADTGIGICADKMELLFQRFSQVDGSATRRYGGTGLGLAISKQLAELMGGTIVAHSEAGQGSEFLLRVPLQAAAAIQQKEFSILDCQGSSISPILVDDAGLLRLLEQKDAEIEETILFIDPPGGPEQCNRVCLTETGELVFGQAHSTGDKLNVDTLRRQLQQLSDIVTHNRFDLAEDAAHRIRATALRAGAHELADAAFKAELAARRGDWNRLVEFCKSTPDVFWSLYKEE